MTGRRRGRYSSEYRERMIVLVRAGRTPGSLAREFEPTEQAIRNWVKQADLERGSPERWADDRGARRDAAPEAGRQAAADGARHPRKPLPGSRGRADRSPAGSTVARGSTRRSRPGASGWAASGWRA